MEYELESDIKLNEDLKKLMDKWESALNEQLGDKQDFLKDGFFPYYTKEGNKRILFIGRDAYDIDEGDNYIDWLYKQYKANKIGKTHINNYAYHSRLFYIAYAIIMGNLDGETSSWQNIKNASEMTEDFATDKGISFALMNLSKIVNYGNIQVNLENIKNAINNEKEFIKEEIELLNPDIIITMNFEGWVKQLFDIEMASCDRNIAVYKYPLGDKEIQLLDTFHFSSTKRDIANFYKPLCKILQNN